MQEVIRKLKEEQNKMIQLQLMLEKKLTDIPEGHLRIQNLGAKCKYYHWFSPSQNPGYPSHGKYLRKDEQKLIHALAQKDYDTALYKRVSKNLKHINYFLTHVDMESMETVYTSLPEFRKELIIPRILTDEDYAEEWGSKQPMAQNSYAFPDHEIYTLRGERVRSKSEKMLADYFNEKGIPYRYEFPIFLDSPNPFYPDFTVLNKRTRKEYLWEHFGLMDDPAYAANAVKKVNQYARNGYIQGMNLILTYETHSSALSTTLIQKLCSTFLE